MAGSRGKEQKLGCYREKGQNRRLIKLLVRLSSAPRAWKLVSQLCDFPNQASYFRSTISSIETI